MKNYTQLVKWFFATLLFSTLVWVFPDSAAANSFEDGVQAYEAGDYRGMSLLKIKQTSELGYMNPEFWKIIGSLMKELPSFIPLPIIKRPYGGSSRNPSEVKSVSDLPKRAFMGTIDETTFKIDKNGWSASYFGYEEGTQVFLKYDINKEWLSLNQTWKGLEGYNLLTPKDGFSYLARSAAGAFPKEWDEAAKRELEDKYNLQYVPTSDEFPTMAAFPDGFLKTLICPIPVSKLREAYNFIKSLDQDLSIETGITGYLTLTTSVVNYVKGKNEGIASDSETLFLHTYKELGITPIGMPEWQTASDGSEALTVRRYHYILVLNIFFRESYKVIDRLHDFGLIGNSNERAKTDHYPSSSEYSVIYLQNMLAVHPIHFSYFDPLNRRRTFYEQFTSIKNIENLIKLEIDEGTIDSFIEKAEHNSKQISYQLNDMFDE